MMTPPYSHAYRATPSVCGAQHPPLMIAQLAIPTSSGPWDLPTQDPACVMLAITTQPHPFVLNARTHAPLALSHPAPAQVAIP